MKKNTSQNSQEGFITRNLYKLSLLIYRKLIRKKQMPGAESVRACLSALYETRDLKEIEESYYANKISIVLLVAIAGCFLALMLHISTIHGSVIEDGNIIKRSAPGSGEESLELEARTEDGKDLGDFELIVDEQVYTRNEADALFEKASREMERVFLGDNPSPERVSADLNLVKELPGYPFEISWQTEDYEVISYDGKLVAKDIPKEGEVIQLTATYKYDDRSWQQVIYINVIQRNLTAAEKTKAAIDRLLESANLNSRYQENLKLPGTYEGSRIIWSEKKEDNSLLLLLLMWIAGAACFALKDKELKEKASQRRQQLLLDYPQLVSQLVLYLGAGMTVRNIFFKLADDYVKKREEGGEPRHMYEELLRTTRQLQAGQSEVKAYEAFGLRCQGQEYTRLCTLLSQNLRKGNGEILKLLQEESGKAFNDRMDTVRKLGEEAGTKLLLPMILMLLIVMVVIMIPAYLTF